MPRPLQYSTVDRVNAIIFLKDDLKSKEITRAQYNKKVTKLNAQEVKFREAKERRRQVGEQKRKENEDRKRRLEEAKTTALAKLARSAALKRAVQQKKLRIGPIIKQKKRLAKIGLRLLTSETRLDGGVKKEVYNLSGKPAVAKKDERNLVTKKILDKIERRNTGFVIVKVTVGYKYSSSPSKNENNGKFYWYGVEYEANEDDEPVDDEGNVVEGGTFDGDKQIKVGTFKYPLDEAELRNKIESIVIRESNKYADVFIKSVEITYSNTPEEGGCDVDTHHKTYNGLKIMSPKSSKNNCLFACIHHKLGKRIMCDTTRKELGIALDTPIRIDDLERIGKHYDVKIKLYNLTGEFTQSYNEEGATECDIMLYVSSGGAGHYVLIEGETHTCGECGKYWVKKHKCNITVRRQMWINRMSGNRNVIPSKVEKEEPFDTNSLLYFDLETFKPKDTSKIVVYASSWFCDGVYYQSYGKDSWTDFMTFVLKQKNKIICAYNGAGFDFHFIMNDLIGRGMEITNVILSGGRLMAMKFGTNLRLWDVCLFTLSSLKDACKSFQVSIENEKTEFDHFKINSWEDVEKYRFEVEPYIKRDVMGMKEVVEKFNEMLYEVFKVHMCNFVTLSSMSYALWSSTTEHLIELPNVEKYDFIRKSLYGGRTYPQQQQFTSKQYNDIVFAETNDKRIELYKSMDDWIFNADATSLYPTAMVKYEYPVGIGEWKTNFDLNAPLQMGIYEVDVEPNKDLVVPILPEKTATGISWNLKNRTGVYTSVDLENALKYGYKITKIHKGLVYQKSGDIFTEYIMKCYKIKEENEDNPVKRQIGKILMNALYGKMLERARFEESQICNNMEDLWKFQTEYSMSDIMFAGDKVVAIGMPLEEELSNSRIRKPSHIGTFILSYSRRHMLDAMSSIEPKLDKPFFTYTDTDSLHIHCSKLPGLDEKGWLSKGLGQLSDDAKGGKIFREINLAPKLYMYLCLMPDGKIKTCMKSKGIPAQYLSPHLFTNAETLEPSEKLILMEHRLKKVGIGRNLQLDFRKYDAFSILSIDMERTFYKNRWTGMEFKDNTWLPLK